VEKSYSINQQSIKLLFAFRIQSIHPYASLSAVMIRYI